jgi:hypothetical protein
MTMIAWPEGQVYFRLAESSRPGGLELSNFMLEALRRSSCDLNHKIRLFFYTAGAGSIPARKFSR